MVRKSTLGVPFNDAYQDVPPWDIGRPQPEIVRLAESGSFTGCVLDAGCGTGENAMFLAGRGHEVLGIDASPLAIDKARAKAAARGSKAKFAIADALHLEKLGAAFDCVIDSGLFHTFADPERSAYVRSLGSVVAAGGSCHVLCFSEREPNWGGPRRVTKAEIESSFADGWTIREIRPAPFATNFDEGDVDGWSVTVRRSDGPMGRSGDV